MKSWPATIDPHWLASLSADERNQFAAALLEVATQTACHKLKGRCIGSWSGEDVAQHAVAILLTRVLPCRTVRFWRAYLQTLVRRVIYQRQKRTANREVLFSVLSGAQQRSHSADSEPLGEFSHGIAAQQISPADEVWSRQVLSQLVLEVLEGSRSVVESFTCIGHLVGYGNGLVLLHWLQEAFPEHSIAGERDIQRRTKWLRDRGRLIANGKLN